MRATAFKGASEFLPQGETPILMAASAFERFTEEEETGHEGDEEDDAGDDVGERKGVLFEEVDVAEERRVLLGGLGEETAKGGTKDATDGPDERHKREGFGLELFFRNHFCYHRSEDAD